MFVVCLVFLVEYLFFRGQNIKIVSKFLHGHHQYLQFVITIFIPLPCVCITSSTKMMDNSLIFFDTSISITMFY